MHFNRKYKYEYIICNYIKKWKYLFPNPNYHTIFNLSSFYLSNIGHGIPGKWRQRSLISLYDERNRTLLHFWLFIFHVYFNSEKPYNHISTLEKKRMNTHDKKARYFHVIKANITSVQLRNIYISRVNIKYNFIWWLTCNNNCKWFQQV